MVARNSLPPWHEEVRLANGREVLIRPIRADDADPLRAAFELLQPAEIRQRFLHTLTEMTPELARRLTQPNPRSGPAKGPYPDDEISARCREEGRRAL